MYNGGFNGDYMAFGLQGRRADFRYNMGSGPAIIASDPISLNEWHTVRLRRDGVDG